MAVREMGRSVPVGEKVEAFRQALVEQCEEREAEGRVPRDGVYPIICGGKRRDGIPLKELGSAFLHRDVISSEERFARHVEVQGDKGSEVAFLKFPTSRERARRDNLWPPTRINLAEITAISISY